MTHLRKHVRRILAEANEAGAPLGIAVHIENGGRHQQLVLEGNGIRRVQPIAGRGDDTAVRRAQADVAKTVRGMVAS